MITNEIRKSIVYMAHYSMASHIGACLSIVEILYTLYFKVLHIDPSNPEKKNRDKFILSKGHASAALYATLAERGFFPKKLLDKYYIDDGVLPGHLDMQSVPGIEISAGSLGHGLSIGVGMALANKIDNNSGKIFVLIGDGECNEGSIWEAAMIAPTLKLNNLTVIIDYNKLQGFGYTNEIINQSNMIERWQSFGWEVMEVDGHDVQKLNDSLKKESLCPKILIANTVKGKDISFMENKLEWHYKSPNENQYKQAINELNIISNKQNS
ncbi:MAG: transketolase [Candidatus Gastranaerophilales bacterium]|nr:transketolase [Candidatus Gastranaerophilales bacterium]